jgi:hypothetical protein
MGKDESESEQPEGTETFVQARYTTESLGALFSVLRHLAARDKSRGATEGRTASVGGSPSEPPGPTSNTDHR